MKEELYLVYAGRWDGGWELRIDGEGVTQCVDLSEAEAMVRDYLATTYDLDSTDHIKVVVMESW